ncbi:MAG: Na-K-Cl cotransporter, partial [bacterium]
AQWREARITIRCIVANESERERAETDLKALILETRIQAVPEVIIKPPDRSVVEVMHETSRRADIVFLGLMDPEPGTEAENAERLSVMASGFNTTIFVRNAGEFAGHLI